MAALPYMQLYVADYLADTAHLSATEHGAYLLLMFNYWQRGESFKARNEQALNKRLASVARLSEDEWENVRDALEEFFDTSETEWVHHRIERDLDAVNAKSDIARAAGKASAAKREAKRAAGSPRQKSKTTTNAQQAFNERSTDVQQTLNHTDTDTDTETETEVKDKEKEGAAGSQAPSAASPGTAVAVSSPKQKTKTASASAETWSAYAEAYRQRYGIDPVRNAKVNGQIAQVVARIGADEAPAVARFYVEHPNAFYVRRGHDVGALLSDAETLRTQWATNRRMTGKQAQDVERLHTNPAWELLQERQAARAAGASV